MKGVKSHGKVESAFNHLYHGSKCSIIYRVSSACTTKIEALCEILRYPLLLAFLGTLPEQLLCVWIVLGFWGAFGYVAVVSLPLCRVIIEREQNYKRLLLHQ